VNSRQGHRRHATDLQEAQTVEQAYARGRQLAAGITAVAGMVTAIGTLIAKPVGA
jgi:hypothetical protein